MSTVGERIGEAREAAGLSKAEFARRLGLSRAAISKMENDPQRGVNGQTLVKIEKTTGYLGTWIATGKGHKKRGDIPAPQPEYKDSAFGQLTPDEQTLAIKMVLASMGEKDKAEILRFLISHKGQDN